MVKGDNERTVCAGEMIRRELFFKVGECLVSGDRFISSMLGEFPECGRSAGATGQREADVPECGR